MIPQRTQRRERGVASIAILVGLVALLGFAAFGIDSGYMLATRTQLQNAADAGAHAAVAELRLGLPHSQAAATAVDVANANFSAYVSGTANVAQVEIGSWDYGSGTFSSSPMSGVAAVKVTTTRQMNFLLAPVLGLNGTVVEASAVAALGQRDVVLVQDVTFSFAEEIGEARNALGVFAQAMVAQSLAGDRLGLVTFAEAASVEQPLSPLPDQLPNILGAIDAFPFCYETSLPNCAGTHIAPGILQAIDLFQTQASPLWAEKVIVLISDGVPCLPGDEATTQARRAAALAAAQAADAAGIHLYSVFLDTPFPGGIYCYDVSGDAADPNLMEELVSGNGEFTTTVHEQDLDQILLSILGAMPVRVVD